MVPEENGRNNRRVAMLMGSPVKFTLWYSSIYFEGGRARS